MAYDIKEISKEIADEIFNSEKNGKYCYPKGLYFYNTENNTFIAIDNRTNNAWTEEFSNLAECSSYLKEETCVDIHGFAHC